jgi:hypothetical protein
MNLSFIKKDSTKKFFAILFFAIILLLPLYSHAQLAQECAGNQPGECTFDDLIRTVIRLTNWGTMFALGFSVVVIAWAGFKYLTSEGNPGKIKEANGMFLKVLQGIVIILIAWTLVKLITTALLKGGINTFLG